jgi:hypothetical protein
VSCASWRGEAWSARIDFVLDIVGPQRVLAPLAASWSREGKGACLLASWLRGAPRGARRGPGGTWSRGNVWASSAASPWRTENGRGASVLTRAPLWSRLAQAGAVVSWASSRHAGAASGGLWLTSREGGDRVLDAAHPLRHGLSWGTRCWCTAVLGESGKVQGTR